MSESLPIGKIKVGERHRKDMGDINALARSIAGVGLLHPIVLRPDHTLVAGERRLKAVRQLEWEVVAVRIVHGLDEEIQALRAEQAENTCRKDWTPVEAANMAKSLRPRVKEAARKREQTGKSADGTAGGRGRKKPKENISQGLNGAGKTQDEIAEMVGVSAPTLTKIEKVVDHGVPALVEAMDKGEVSVSAAAAVAELPEAEQEEVVSRGAPAVQKKGKEVNEEKKEKTEERRAKVMELRQSGLTEREIAAKLGVSRSLIRRDLAKIADKHGPEAAMPHNETSNGAKKGVGIRLAHEALNCLTRIPKNDCFRRRGFQIVMDWLRHNK